MMVAIGRSMAGQAAIPLSIQPCINSQLTAIRMRNNHSSQERGG